MKKIILLLLFQQALLFSQEIKDLILPLNLKAGETDSILITDIFYSDSYSIKLLNSDNIESDYIEEKKLLILKPSPGFEGLTLQSFLFNNKEFQIPVNVSVLQQHTFQFASGNASKVNLFGSFNGWNRENIPMQDKDNDRIFETTIYLEPGLYEYKFFADGEELIDPGNPDQKPNGFGGFNSLITIPPGHSGKNYLHLIDKSLEHSGYKLSFLYESDEKIKLTHRDIIALAGNEKIPAEKIKISENRILIFLEGEKYISSETPLIRVAVNRNGISSNIQQVKLNNKPAPEDMIMYALMIDRFYDGDNSNSKPVQHPEIHTKANYQGGDLKGIINKIDEGYFTSLGINTIWISPVNDNTNSAYKEFPPPHRFYSGYHGYWPVSSTNVEERFGNIDLLKELVKKAHEKDIKILLDFVSNHVHIEHPLWIEHRDWFGVPDLPDGRKNLRLWDEERLTTWFEPYLPSFDYLNSKDALEFMTDNAVWWLKETGADGFRHDAVKHVPNEFWRMLTGKIKREIGVPENKFIYQIGETFGSYDLVGSYVNNGQLTAQFNFNLYDVALPVFLNKGNSFTLLDNELKKTFSVYGVNNLMGNVMDSHDKVRYMAYADADILLSDGNTGEIGWTNPPQVDYVKSYEKLKLYLAYILTIPGIPVIYYGDEIGLTGAADPDNRRMMKFDNELNNTEKGVLRDVKRIINIRKESSALRNGDFLTLFVDDDAYAFVRSDGNERILVALNKGNSDKMFDINLPEFYKIRSAGNLSSEEGIRLNNNRLSFSVPSEGWLIMKLHN